MELDRQKARLVILGDQLTEQIEEIQDRLFDFYWKQILGQSFEEFLEQVTISEVEKQFQIINLP